MNRIFGSCLFRCREIYAERFTPNRGTHKHHGELTYAEISSELLNAQVASGKPSLIARYGSGELNAVATYLRKINKQRWPTEKTLSFIKGDIGTFWWHDGIRQSLSNNAGMFSTDNRSLDQFAERILDDSRYIDILGSWLDEEVVLEEYLVKCKKVALKDLEPYFSSNPWSIQLKNKNVLVVHPFVDSIKKQYSKRNTLFKNKCVLPEFNLMNFKPVQTIAGNHDPRFSHWLDALKWMEDEIAKLEFDVAIIGAGSYGLPLAASIKRHGKIAIHLGGATQILFGIRGKRWENRPEFQELINEDWKSPLPYECPKGSEKVEGGCYW